MRKRPPPASPPKPAPENKTKTPPANAPKPRQGKEVGGRKGPEPTRYGDWEKNGRAVDF